MENPFQNVAHTDFTNADARAAFASAINDCRESLPVLVRPVVDGSAIDRGATFARECPSDLNLTVTQVHHADAALADTAIAAAKRAWPEWRKLPIDERASILERVADTLEQRRYSLAALQAFEVAKPWREADADVAEAIDFCRYYAHRARTELAPRRMGNVPGERNELWYEGRGVAAVIAPWNFPLAILCGMTTAALVSGNTVVMKPAEQSSAIGQALHEVLLEAGAPPEVVHFLPGDGAEVGKRVVEHPDVSTIAFTGSMEVGLSILEQAGKTDPQQAQIKRVVCEMGGKNAIIVDDDADLDESIAGVVSSAFGYAGQKCSACSRVIVVGNAYRGFVDRLIEGVRSLHMAPADDPACQLGPVVDRESFERLKGVVSAPGDGVKTLLIGNSLDSGYFVPACIFETADPMHPLMQRELFGPILMVMNVDSFEAAIDAANATPFALTGGLYSRNPDHVDLARERFRVGNLYINRGITGAWVQRQPFGGFKMSGAGSKAGGPHYLFHFSDPRCMTENTMRHGFTPDLDN